MKKYLTIILVFIFSIISPVCANVLPTSVKDIPSNTIGVYQADSIITIYTSPQKTANIIKEIKVVNPEYRENEYANIFGILIPKKNLGYLYVTDTTDDDWVEVIYDKKKMLKGWVLKNDDFQFLPWINFYNMYGRKYGLKYLKNTPDGIYNIQTQTDTTSKVLGQTIKSREIRLTAIEGIWMLVSVLDSNYSINTGYILWRNISGEIYLFPNLK